MKWSFLADEVRQMADFHFLNPNPHRRDTRKWSDDYRTIELELRVTNFFLW